MQFDRRIRKVDRVVLNESAPTTTATIVARDRRRLRRRRLRPSSPAVVVFVFVDVFVVVVVVAFFSFFVRGDPRHPLRADARGHDRTIAPPRVDDLPLDPCPEPQRRQQDARSTQQCVDVVDLAFHQKADARVVQGEDLGRGIRAAHANRRVGEARTYRGPDFAAKDADGIDVRGMSETADECVIAPVPEGRQEEDGGASRR